MHNDSLKKRRTNQREVTQKLRKGEQSFLYATHGLNLIRIASKFQDIHKYLLMVPTSVKKFIKGN